MKSNLLTLLCSATLAAAVTSPAQAEDSAAPTLFVSPFTGDNSAISYWQPALGEGLCEMLITEMGRINKFQVLETTQLGALKEEIKMGEDGWIEQNQKVEKGGWAAADFMFAAKVTRFGNKETTVGLGGIVSGSLGGLGVKQTMADVRIDWRLVDTDNRKIIKTGSATASQKGLSIDAGAIVSGNGGGLGFNNHEFMDSALGKATVKALAQITNDVCAVSLPESGRHRMKAGAAAQQAAATAQQAAAANSATAALHAKPGKVLAVANKDTIILSLGSSAGFKAGDTLDLFEAVDTKDASGAVVFTDNKLVGEVVLQSVQEDRSKASYSGNLEVKAGWTVKAR